MKSKRNNYGIERREHEDTKNDKHNWYSTEWFETPEERDKKLVERNAGASDEQPYQDDITVTYRKIKIVSDD